jgi:chromatin remodeling complex protein RSC6
MRQSPVGSDSANMSSRRFIFVINPESELISLLRNHGYDKLTNMMFQIHEALKKIIIKKRCYDMLQPYILIFDCELIQVFGTYSMHLNQFLPTLLRHLKIVSNLAVSSTDDPRRQYLPYIISRRGPVNDPLVSSTSSP